LAIGWLVLAFAGAGVAVWLAGVKLADTTDVLSVRLGLGEALGGLILLGIATNLPEIAITVSAALANNLGIAVGNILGGIALQTVVLAVLDGFGLGERDSLSFRAASLSLVLEGVLVAILLVVAIMGTQLPSSLTRGRVDPAAFAILLLWIVGVWLVGRARHGLPWHSDGHAPESQQAPAGHSCTQREQHAGGTERVAITFSVAAVVTLIGGVVLERAGEGIATHIGMTGVLFGATFLAAATSLPELSTGLAAVKLGDYKLAFSDIFGGNAFLPVLFLLASLISGQSVLPYAHDTDIYLAGLGVFLTGVYIIGLIFRPRRQVAGRLGIDSTVVIASYAIALLGLVAITSA
jgi:cation:H+ antiporter